MTQRSLLSFDFITTLAVLLCFCFVSGTEEPSEVPEGQETVLASRDVEVPVG